MRSLLDKWAVQVKALKIAVRSHMFNGPRGCSREAYRIWLWVMFST